MKHILKNSVVVLEDNAAQAANFLKAIANTHRLMVLCSLSGGERSVADLIGVTGISATSMSQHLAKLKDEGLVDFRRDHRTLYYYISNPQVLRIIGVLHDIYCH